MNAKYNNDPARFPGAVFAAETGRDGALVAAVGNGWQRNTVCEIGSMTKPFTAVALLMALEGRGLLNPDKYVHELPGGEVWAGLPQQDPRRQITVRHLLQHRSGLPWFVERNALRPPPCNSGGTTWTGSPGLTNECVLADGAWSQARAVGLYKVAAFVMQNYAPEFQPGAQYRYSNFDYIVAGRVVEALTGKSLSLYLKEKLFGPLGMADSFFLPLKTGDATVDAKLFEGVTAQQVARIAKVTNITPDGNLPPEVAPALDTAVVNRWDERRKGWRFVWPEGGMYSTADDQLKFLRVLRDRGRRGGNVVLSGRVWELVVKEQGGVGSTMAFPYKTAAVPDGQGAGTLDHLGRFMTYFWYDPRQDNPVLGVFLSQRLTRVAVGGNVADGVAVINQFVKLVYEGVRAAPENLAEAPDVLSKSLQT
jgi:CubicO group peptidase (beta-lactamase class C family)